MNEAERILVVILASFLALFLITAVILVVEVVKLVRSAKEVVAKAENIVTSASSITEVFTNVSGPLAAVKLIRNIMKTVNKRRK